MAIVLATMAIQSNTNAPIGASYAHFSISTSILLCDMAAFDTTPLPEQPSYGSYEWVATAALGQQYADAYQVALARPRSHTGTPTTKISAIESQPEILKWLATSAAKLVSVIASALTLIWNSGWALFFLIGTVYLFYLGSDLDARIATAFLNGRRLIRSIRDFCAPYFWALYPRLRYNFYTDRAWLYFQRVDNFIKDWFSTAILLALVLGWIVVLTRPGDILERYLQDHQPGPNTNVWFDVPKPMLTYTTSSIVEIDWSEVTAQTGIHAGDEEAIDAERPAETGLMTETGPLVEAEELTEAIKLTTSRTETLINTTDTEALKEDGSVWETEVGTNRWCYRCQQVHWQKN